MVWLIGIGELCYYAMLEVLNISTVMLARSIYYAHYYPQADGI